MLQITLRSIREKKLGKKWFDTCLLAFTGINQLIFDHPNGFWKLGLVEECSEFILCSGLDLLLALLHKAALSNKFFDLQFFFKMEITHVQRVVPNQ